ncbi:pac motif [Lucifera butyrica]|uniref:Pac motif n=1 Tax=Lucifera butyrica TaxID=1351585 RepID=A0A498R810_9FIRM|nr:PAS domain-containing protein [Lucifera butyrica]VBB05278.1 pac motif [Lucifera butyrica]
MQTTDRRSHSEAHPGNEKLLNQIKVLERKLFEAEAKCLATEEKYQRIINNVQTVIFQTDAAGRWTFLNSAWTKITRFAISESAGTLFLDYVHPDDREHNQELLKLLIERKKEYCHHEVRYLTKGDGVRWMEVYARLMLNDAGKIIGITGTLNDITEWRLNRELQLERALQLSCKLQLQSDFINDIVSGRTFVDEQAIVFAKSIGLDFSQPLCCCLVTCGYHTEADRKNDEADYRQLLKNRIITVLSDESNCIVWNGRDNIGILYQGGEGGMRLAGRLRDKVRRFYPQLDVIVGVGESKSGPGSVYESYRQAWSAVAAARCKGGSSEGIYHYRDLGLFQLLASIGRKETAQVFIEEKIGKLLDYDREKGTDYLVTLEAILQTSNLKEAAEKLFIHHKTAVFRKRRIEKMLEISVDHFEDRLSLAVAIKLHKLNGPD